MYTHVYISCTDICIYHVCTMYTQLFKNVSLEFFFSIKSGNECLCKTELLVDKPRDSALPGGGILGTFILFYYFFS